MNPYPKLRIDPSSELAALTESEDGMIVGDQFGRLRWMPRSEWDALPGSFKTLRIVEVLWDRKSILVWDIRAGGKTIRVEAMRLLVERGGERAAEFRGRYIRELKTWLVVR